MAGRTVDRKKAYEILQALNPPSKTPVSLSMELATRLCIPIEFREPTVLTFLQQSYECIARLGDLETVGYDKSKKGAKQNSAQKLIDAIIEEYNTLLSAEGNDSSQGTSCNSATVGTPQRERYSSPSPSRNSSGSDSNSTIVNSVGELQTLSAKKRWKLPEYEYPEPEGEPNNRVFKCRVKLTDIETSGKASTKKVAKQRAAENMLNILQGQGYDSVDAQGQSPLYPQLSTPDSLLSSSDLEDSQSSDSDDPSSNLDSTNDVDETHYDELAITKLKIRSVEEKFTIDYFPLPNTSKKGFKQVFGKVTFNEIERPPVVTQGSGNSVEIAKMKAAERILKHLEMLVF